MLPVAIRWSALDLKVNATQRTGRGPTLVPLKPRGTPERWVDHVVTSRISRDRYHHEETVTATDEQLQLLSLRRVAEEPTAMASDVAGSPKPERLAGEGLSKFR